jgi:hypothetical protein
LKLKYKGLRGGAGFSILFWELKMAKVCETRGGGKVIYIGCFQEM